MAQTTTQTSAQGFAQSYRFLVERYDRLAADSYIGPRDRAEYQRRADHDRAIMERFEAEAARAASDPCINWADSGQTGCDHDESAHSEDGCSRCGRSRYTTDGAQS